jgi:hypothetical protein
MGTEQDGNGDRSNIEVFVQVGWDRSGCGDRSNIEAFNQLSRHRHTCDLSPEAVRDVSKAARFAFLKASKPGRFAYTDKYLTYPRNRMAMGAGRISKFSFR